MRPVLLSSLIIALLGGCTSTGPQMRAASYPEPLPPPNRLAESAIKNTAIQETRRLIDAMPGVSNIIIGGGMKSCSSMNGTNESGSNPRCALPWSKLLLQDPAFAGLSVDDVSFNSTITLPAFTYSINANTIAAFRTLPDNLVSEIRKRALLPKLTARANSSEKPLNALSFADFSAIFTDTSAADAAPLTIIELAALRHSFVDTPSRSRSKRQVQARSVAFLTDPASQAIYREFIRAASLNAAGKKPKIGLVTASSENPFNDHDIYSSALTSAGANVVWLPIDGGFREAIDKSDCDNIAIYYAAYASKGSERRHFHMDKIFPDLAEQQRSFCINNGARFNAELEGLDGIFFTGGDQSRHLQSFITRDAQGAHTKSSAQLAILRARFAAGKLVVAGSSAGNAVQSGGQWQTKPVPMLAGGDSWSVLVNGFIDGGDPIPEKPESYGARYAQGGLGFFHFGPLDSHFSNRAREARLVRLVQESGMDYGFGVDENTALVVGKADASGTTSMVVIGAAGVFIAETSAAKNNGKVQYNISDVRIHYLTAGDAANIDRAGKLTIQLSPHKALLPPQTTAPIITQQDVFNTSAMNFLKMTQAMGQSGAPMAVGTTAGSKRQNLPTYTAIVSRTPSSEFRDGDNGNMSYTNLTLSFMPCLNTCGPSK